MATRTLLPTTALAGLLACGSAQAGQEGQIEAFAGVAYRHSFGLDMGGFAFTAGLGGYVGVFGVEYQMELSNDHSFSHLESRHYARSTNWFNVVVRGPLGDHVDIGFAFGPGLGFVKNAGKPYEVGGRFPSEGLHEELRLGFNLQDSDNVVLGLRVRVGAEHLWQYAIVRGPEHAVTGGIEFYLGPSTE